MGLLVNETMQRAQPVDELGARLFPDAEAELADLAARAGPAPGVVLDAADAALAQLNHPR